MSLDDRAHHAARAWAVPALATAAAALLIATIVVLPQVVGGPDAPLIRPADGTPSDPSPTAPESTPVAPERWERVDDATLSQVEGPAMLYGAVSTGNRVVAFSTHMEPLADGGFTSAGTDAWWSADGREWTRETAPELLGAGRDLVDVVRDGSVLVAVIRRDATTYDLYESPDGVSWQQREQVGTDLGDDGGDVSVTAVATGPGTIAVVGHRVATGDEVERTQPVAVVRGASGWRVEALGEAAFDHVVEDVAVIGDRIVAVGHDQAGGVIWQRTEGGWESFHTARALQHVVATSSTTLLAVGTTGSDATVVEGPPVGWELDVRDVDLEGVRVFDLTAVDGTAVGVGNTVASGPGDRPAVVTFVDGAPEIEFLEGSALLRGIARHHDTLVAVGEATDDEGDGYVSRPAVWVGPLPRPAGPDGTTAPSPVAGSDVCDPTLAPTDEDLPAAVTDMRNAIVAALRTCDLGALVALGEQGESVNVSFGGQDLTDAWVAEQAALGPTGDADAPNPLAALGVLLTLPSGVVDTADGQRIHVWPRLFADASAVARQELLDTGLYSPGALERMEATIGAYVGWRVGITDDGDWIYLVAGD